MAKKIFVWTKQPGEPAHNTWMKNELHDFQKFVGGCIECPQIAIDAVIICNEEGIPLGLPFNTTIAGMDLYGPIILAGTKGEEFADFPIYDDATMKMMFPELWEESEVKYD